MVHCGPLCCESMQSFFKPVGVALMCTHLWRTIFAHLMYSWTRDSIASSSTSPSKSYAIFFTTVTTFRIMITPADHPCWPLAIVRTSSAADRIPARNEYIQNIYSSDYAQLDNRMPSLIKGNIKWHGLSNVQHVEDRRCQMVGGKVLIQNWVHMWELWLASLKTHFERSVRAHAQGSECDSRDFARFQHAFAFCEAHSVVQTTLD